MEGRIAALPIHPGTLFWGQPMVQPKNTEIRFNGTVRRFIAARGYGFLTPDPGQGLAVDVLFHEIVLRGITDPILPGGEVWISHGLARQCDGGVRTCFAMRTC